MDMLREMDSDFIFSLTKEKMFKNNNKKRETLFNNKDYFPCFGDWTMFNGFDIYLTHDCFTTRNSYSHFPSSYGVGDVIDENKSIYLTGNNNFKVLRIEIFKINF